MVILKNIIVIFSTIEIMHNHAFCIRKFLCNHLSFLIRKGIYENKTPFSIRDILLHLMKTFLKLLCEVEIFI